MFAQLKRFPLPTLSQSPTVKAQKVIIITFIIKMSRRAEHESESPFAAGRGQHGYSMFVNQSRRKKYGTVM